MDASLREILGGRHAGKWRVQYIQVNDLGRKKRLSRLFDTKRDGRDFLQSRRHGTKVAIARQREFTLALWFDWLAEHDWPENPDEKTIAFRKARFDRHGRKVLGQMPLRKVDPLAVRAFYRELREGGVGDATVHAIKANLVRVFNQALTPYGRVPITMTNPFRLEIHAPTLKEVVALTPEEARAAVACETLTPKDRALLATFLLAGLRLSEQMAVTRGQLMLDKGLIVVDRAVRLDSRGGQSVGPPKGDKKRLAVMCPTLKAILCEIVADLPPGPTSGPPRARTSRA